MPDMQQAKFSLTPPLVDFLNHHQAYGYRDRSEMVRSALQRLRDELELQSLRESADLYAEVYAEDLELQTLTEAAIEGWPE
jgi:Arc/MetJ-type ribon-helix-helix transcriptional regulator